MYAVHFRPFTQSQKHHVWVYAEMQVSRHMVEELIKEQLSSMEVQHRTLHLVTLLIGEVQGSL